MTKIKLGPSQKQNKIEHNVLEIGTSSWLEKELMESNFKDKRLNKRLKTVMKKLWGGLGKPIPFACEDWANTKAAYRFLDNKKVSETEILKGHFASTERRFSKTKGPLLILHDATEFSYQRNKPELVGATRLIDSGRKSYGQLKRHTICGLLMHSSLVVTTDEVPLGLSAIKFWTRKKFKGCNALKKRVNPTRIPIEEKESYRWIENVKQSTECLADPQRCIHIGDRESDIYELFCTAKSLGAHFLVRTCVDRLADDGNHTIKTKMKSVKVQGTHTIEVLDKKGKPSRVTLNLQYRRIKVLPPIGKQKHYPELNLTVIHATEKYPPKHRESIVWKLMTDLEVNSNQSAIEKLNWYALRWRIETFHKILKSGCQAEALKLRTADRLTNLISIFCILSWRIFWITMLNRSSPNETAELVLTDSEIDILNIFVKDQSHTLTQPATISHCLLKIAKLGGYLARASDPPPGNMIMWRGMARLTDISLGFELAKELMGN